MKQLVIILLFGAQFNSSLAQCLSYPLSMEKRVQGSEWLVLGRVGEKHCYRDQKGIIYTLNKINVSAWMKNYRSQSSLFVITLGGILNDRAQITYPAVQLRPGNEYVFFIEKDNTEIDDDDYRAIYPDAIQSLVYADAQGALLYQNGNYHDVLSKQSMPEEELIQKIKVLTGQQPRKPDGSLYVARNFVALSTQAITGFSPNPTNAGTIDPGDLLTITGSGFGASPGIVEFQNADDGGATVISPPNTTDYVSWSDGSITVKVPSNAGTGVFTVNGTFTSASPLTIGYAHISIDDVFFNFASSTRQRYYLRNKNTLGGYSFLYNTTSGFSANAAAVAAFERALTEWRCPDKINWRSAGTTAAVFAQDGINSVLFDGSLPAGVLGTATSYLSASATAGCDMFNTVWWVDEIDVQFAPDPPVAGFPWQFGTALATSSEIDFESVAEHELGHAFGLGHRIAAGELMNWTIANGENIRTPVAIERTGTNVKLAYSTVATCFDPGGSGTQMVAWDGTGCVLPVELTSFIGECKNFGTELVWNTSMEINSDRFEIEGSTDTRNFRFIGYQNAQQQGSQTKTYRYVDKNNLPGVIFYRLKMLDKDGRFTYSPVIKIVCSGISNELTIFPNPVKSVLIIESARYRELRLLNLQGQQLKSVILKEGRNEIDLSHFPDGLYILFDPVTANNTKIMVVK